MKVVAVPNELHDAIHYKITQKLAGRPITEEDREYLYNELLAYFDEHGFIPDFELSSQE